MPITMQYPDDFKAAVMSMFPDDKGVQALLDCGSREVRTLLEAHFQDDRLSPSFTATRIHSAVNQGNQELLDSLKQEVAEIAYWGELLDWFSRIDDERVLDESALGKQD